MWGGVSDLIYNIKYREEVSDEADSSAGLSLKKWIEIGNILQFIAISTATVEGCGVNEADLWY